MSIFEPPDHVIQLSSWIFYKFGVHVPPYGIQCLMLAVMLIGILACGRITGWWLDRHFKSH